MRIVHVATDAAFQRLLGGAEHAARLVRERAGHAFDPRGGACLVDEAAEILALEESASAWDEVLASEPARRSCWRRSALERALAAMGNFADLDLAVPRRPLRRRRRARRRGGTRSAGSTRRV